MVNRRTPRGSFSPFTIYPKWWPGTESNRRRRPFQGRLPNRRSGLKSMDVTEREGLMTSDLGWFRMVSADLVSCCRSTTLAQLVVTPEFENHLARTPNSP